MEDPTTGSKRALKAIIIEIIVITIIILIVGFVFKIIPFNGSSFKNLPFTSQLPIPPNAPDVRMALTIYSINGEVKSVTPTKNKDIYSLVLKKYPNQIFLYSKNALVKKSTPSGFIKIQDVTSGTQVIIGSSYNLQTKKWSLIPAIPQNLK